MSSLKFTKYTNKHGSMTQSQGKEDLKEEAQTLELLANDIK